MWIIKVIFNLEELRGITLPPPFELELLKLDVNVGNSTLSFDYGSLIDGLLWSCCPKIFSLPTVLDFQKKCIKVCLFFYKILKSASIGLICT